MKKLNILIVEDEAIVGLDLKRALNKIGYNVLDIFRRGEEAVKFIENADNLPDIILMDVMLAGILDGTETAAEIKKRRNIPVIYITAYSDDQTFKSARLTNPFGYILKPFDERLLYISIEMAVHKHRLEQSLDESEKRYRYLVENSPLGICICGDGNFLFANSAAVKLLGAESANEIENHKISEFFNSHFLELVSEQPELNSSLSEPFSQKITKRNGVSADVEITFQKTFYKDKPAIQLIIKDMSEILKRDKLQQTVIRILQAGNLSGSIEELYFYIKKVVADIIPQGKFYMAIENEGEVNKTYFPLNFSQTDQFELYERKVLDTGMSLMSKNGQNSFSDLSLKKGSCWVGVPLQINEKIRGVIAVQNSNDSDSFSIEDKETLELISYPISRAIEKRIINDEQAEYTKKLQELNEAKDKFFSLISHDLKSPFNSLLGFIEILKNENQSLSDYEKVFFINTIYDSAKNIFDQLSDLLEYSASRSIAAEFKPGKVNLKMVIDRSLKNLNNNAVNKKINIKTEIPEDIFVLAEEDMLLSAMMNLISNAIKFTNSNGEVTICANEEEKFILCEITDTGVGMDDDFIKNLFKIENKISTPGTENESGTGLGLLLVKELVEKNRGTIELKSTPGNGTSCFLRIPKLPKSHNYQYTLH